MQHDVTALALRVLATALVGPSHPDQFGLTTVRLGGPAAATGRHVELLELGPPQPDRLRLINRGAGSATMQSGEVTSGGMAERVVTQSVVIASGARTDVRVEPLVPRWADQGDIRLAGALRPVGQALVALMTGDRVGLRSVARTALWEAARNRGLVAELAGSDTGWALLDGRRPLAARLVVSAAIRARPAAGATRGGDHSRSLVRAISHAIAAMDFRVSRLGQDGADIILVRPGFELADAVIDGGQLALSLATP